MNDLSLASKLRSLSPEQLAELRLQLKQRSSISVIRPRSQVAELPEGLQITVNGQSAWKATSTQARLWFLEQYLGPNPLYNIVRSIRLRGALNISALDAAFNQLVQRHEALRTNFCSVDGIPYQVVKPSSDRPSLEVVDLRTFPADDREMVFQHQLGEFGRQPFDLSQDCLLRAVLFQLDATEFGLMIVIHHIVADGWSFGVLAKEISQLYRQFGLLDGADLPELPLQFIDYGLWLQTELQAGRRDTDRQYWQQKLSGDLPILNLPYENLRPLTQTYIGQRQPIVFGANLVNAMKGRSQEAGVSLFMLLLSSLKALLHRYSQQTDIIIGSPTANRADAAIEGVIGYFVDNLPLRTDLSGDPTFLALLDRVRQTALDAYTHTYPFAEILETVPSSQGNTQSPLFSVMMALQNTPEADFELPGMLIASCQPDDATWAEKISISNYRFSQDLQAAKFDLTVLVKEEAGEIAGFIEYNQALFKPDTIERLIGHWQTLLQSALANPQMPISQLPLLTDREQAQLLSWGTNAADQPPQLAIQTLFELQVAQNPTKTALQCNDASLSYQILNEKANQLAHHLRKLGVQPNQMVGIYLERSLDFIIVVLAILKAGGAYLPLDRAYPSERLQFMLEDAQVQVLIADHRPTALRLDGVELIDLATHWSVIAESSVANPTLINRPNHLAYVLYTSGSTGKPKGVMVTHQAVVRLVVDTNYIDLSATDVVAQVANVSFDAATFEIWGALLNGAQLNILIQEQVLAPQVFAAALEAQSITVMFLTTALLNQFAQVIPMAFSGLRYLLFGGEAATPHWIKQILEKSRPAHLLHVYGPTENTTFSTFCAIDYVDESSATLPIGRPITHTECIVLDQAMQPVPIGGPGELYLGGLGVAQGYLDRLELTETRFIDIPGRSAKFYKTGDLVRYLPDGNLEFIGRLDHQVKIRGFRIELGEVEAALKLHPAVKDALVILDEDAQRGKELWAYVTAEPPLPENQLKQFLQQTLPDYLIPASYLCLERFPLTPNGKVDRQALPKPTIAEIARSTNPILPQTPLEQELVTIWSEVLKCPMVDTNDSFFDMGGHSLLAMPLLAQVEKTFKRKISLSQLFQFPTIMQMAQLLEQEAETSLTFSLTAPQVGKKTLFWCAQNLTDVNPLVAHLGAEQPFCFLENDIFAIEHPATYIHDRATQGIQQIKAIQPEGPYYIGGFCLGGVIAFEMALQLQERGEVVKLILVESWNPAVPKDRLKQGLKYHYQQFSERKLSQRLKYLLYLSGRIVNVAKRRVASRFAVEQILPPEEIVHLAGEQGLKSKAAYQARSQFEGETLLCFSQEALDVAGLLLQSGWGALLSRSPELYAVTGHHLSLVEEPGVEQLTNRLKRLLGSD